MKKRGIDASNPKDVVWSGPDGFMIDLSSLEYYTCDVSITSDG